MSNSQGLLLVQIVPFLDSTGPDVIISKDYYTCHFFTIMIDSYRAQG
jgi:hypothetical protein